MCRYAEGMHRSGDRVRPGGLSALQVTAHCAHCFCSVSSRCSLCKRFARAHVHALPLKTFHMSAPTPEGIQSKTLQTVARCWSDPEIKQRLISNAHATLSAEGRPMHSGSH